MRPFHYQLMVNCELQKDNPCLLNNCSNTDRVHLPAINVVLKRMFCRQFGSLAKGNLPRRVLNRYASGKKELDPKLSVRTIQTLN